MCQAAGWKGPSTHPSCLPAEVSTPTSFGAEDAAGKMRWPTFPPTIFIVMEVSYLARAGQAGNVRLGVGPE
jgi:hypothetical protein